MPEFKSGVLDSTRIVSNILMLVLLAGNIYFSVNYINDNKLRTAQETQQSQEATERIQATRTLKDFINIVLNTTGDIPYEDRVKMESDITTLHDAGVLKQWQDFVASPDSKTAQTNAVKFMSALANKSI